MIECRCSSVEETKALGKKLASCLRPDDCIVLNGDLGAGKTQLAKGLADGLGVADEVTSPTFNILFEYVGDEIPLLHFDLYRLDDDEELEDIDFYGLLESGAACLIEWGNKFEGAMPEERLELEIKIDQDEDRIVTARGIGKRGEELESALRQQLEDRG